LKYKKASVVLQFDMTIVLMSADTLKKKKYLTKKKIKRTENEEKSRKLNGQNNFGVDRR